MINRYLIKKWIGMIRGNSLLYVDQKIGCFFSTKSVEGYYNDLRDKVKKDKKTSFGMLPINEATKETTQFPIQIFQFGLGSYDCYLETKNDNYLKSFFASSDFALRSMRPDGSWIVFPANKNPFSGMCQGEGISLLARAYVLTKKEEYFQACTKAFVFLKEKTIRYQNDGSFLLYEFCDSPIVFNGMVYGLFGIFDYYLLTKRRDILVFFEKGERGLRSLLPVITKKRWCLYSLDGKLCSAFYLRTHIALCQAMFIITQNDEYQKYSLLWEKDLGSAFNRCFYFCKKAIQKVKERGN